MGQQMATTSPAIFWLKYRGNTTKSWVSAFVRPSNIYVTFFSQQATNNINFEYRLSLISPMPFGSVNHRGKVFNLVLVAIMAFLYSHTHCTSSG